MSDPFKALNRGIDVGEKIVTSSHNFQNKLISVETLLWSLSSRYSKYDPRFPVFFKQMIREVQEFIEATSAFLKGDLHIVTEEKAMKEKGPAWALQFKKKVKGIIDQESEAELIHIQLCKEFFERMRGHIERANHLFDVDIESATVTDVKVDLKRSKDHFSTTMQDLLKFILAYETIFRTAEKELEE